MKEHEKEVSRRKFTEGAATGTLAVAGLLSGCSQLQDQETGNIAVEVLDGDGDRLGNTSVKARRLDDGYVLESQTDENGEVEFNNTRIGDYEVTAYCSDLQLEETVNLTEGETERVTIKYTRDFDEC